MIPKIRVFIQDRSYNVPNTDTDSTTFVVILGNQGPHNRVMKFNSVQDMIRLVGKPNMEKTGIGHYLLERALRYGTAYAIRASLIDSETESKNAAIANSIIKFNSPEGSEQEVNGKFIFTNSTNATTEFTDSFISKYVFTDLIGFEQLKVGDSIYRNGDDSISAQKIVSKGNKSSGIYYLELENNYSGTTTVDTDNGNALLVSVIDPQDYLALSDYNVNINNVNIDTSCYEYYPGVETIPSATFTFTNGSNIVIATDQTSFNSVNEEEWIFPISGTSTLARQIVKRRVNETTNAYELVLDDNYEGTTSIIAESAKKYIPIEIISLPNIRADENFDLNDNDNIFYFVAKGTGTDYNNIYFKATRNVTLERMYVDEDGVPMYKYLFMDLTIYKKNNDGSSTILETFTVSLINKTADDEIIRDINTGREMYIESVINERSEFVSCYQGNGVKNLEGLTPTAEKNRLQFQTLFADGEVYALTTRGMEGFFLQNGDDGALYNSQGKINLYDSEIIGTVERAYRGTLPSVDGSIETIIDKYHPTHEFTYVVTGGYSPEIQKAGMDFGDLRGTTFHLGDTGGYKYNYGEDILARETDVAFNSRNSALYAPYSEITDTYTGRKIKVTPVLFAIEAHLKSDIQNGVSEPVAGISTGAITDSGIKLAYKARYDELEELSNIQINSIVSDKSGVYFTTQLTTWKQYSKSRHIHVVKFLQKITREIPPLLKDILNRRATPYWINQAKDRVNRYLSKYVATEGRNAALNAYNLQVVYDDTSNEIIVTAELNPIGVIELITVDIIVV